MIEEDKVYLTNAQLEHLKKHGLVALNILDMDNRAIQAMADEILKLRRKHEESIRQMAPSERLKIAFGVAEDKLRNVPKKVIDDIVPQEIRERFTP